MWVKHLTSLQFLTYVAFFGVVLAVIARFVPGKQPPVRTEPFSEEELGAHDRKLAKYFVAGALFLVLGAIHGLLKNLPWLAEWLARAGYAGHLVRDLSNTHVMIVGGGTLIATGLVWFALPRAVGRPLASEGLASTAFWCTAGGLLVFYVALLGNGIAMAPLIEHGWAYPAAKAHMGKWYRVPVGMGAGVMGIGYWCFAANVLLTIFHSRLVRVPKPSAHLWKYFATGAAGLTVGTVQGVIQVTPHNAGWLYAAGHAGEWIDPISHAHVNLVTGLTMLVAGSLFALVPRLGGEPPSRKTANIIFGALLCGSLTFYAVALYLGFHEGRLVVSHGLTPARAEAATPLHPYLIMVGGIAMFAAFWAFLWVAARSVRPARGPIRAFVLAGCGALAVGTLQGPIQAFPAVNELLDRGGDAGDVIVNLHAQLNMLGGLMVILAGLAIELLALQGARLPLRRARLALAGVAGGMLVYYAGGIGFSAVEAHAVAHGRSFGAAVAALEPWQALVLVPAAVCTLAGFAAFALAVWPMSARQRAAGRSALALMPSVYTGKIPRRVARRSPASMAGYELPMALLGFPGVGWLFAGFPFTASILLLGGPAFAWAVLPIAFSPYGEGPLRPVGWHVELVYLPLTALLSSALLFRAHARRRARLRGRPPRGRRRRSGASYRTRVAVAGGALLLVLVALPFVPAVAGVGSSSVRYSVQPRLTKEITGAFLQTRKGPVQLFRYGDPQQAFPADALRVHAGDASRVLVRAAAVDAPDAYQLYDLTRGQRIRLEVEHATRRALELAPAHPLAPGRYELVTTHEGMFGGKDFAYLSVVGPGAPVTAIGSGADRRTVAPVARAFPPIAASLVALAFAFLLGRSWRRRPAGQKALWAAGFLLFAAAAACQATAQRTGWTPGLFRAYYCTGGVLTVAYLGAGSAWLQLRPRGRDVLVGALAVATLAGALTVALAPVDAAALAATSLARPPSNSALGGHAFLWAVALNSLGTLFLVGGSALSALRRQRVRANVWIGGGAAIVALATGLSRAGSYGLVELGELLGVAVMFAGFTIVSAPPRGRASQSAGAAVDRPALAK